MSTEVADKTNPRSTPGSVIDRLERSPYQFDFFQAVRVLQWLANDPTADLGRPSGTVGEDNSPDKEVVRFRALRSNGFAQQAVHGFRYPDGTSRPEMDVSFLGMTGPAGALPRHYTQMVIERTRYGDFSLADFLDMFNHRFVSLFYRAWAKYRLPILYEQAHQLPDAKGADICTRSLLAIVGWGTPGLTDRQDVAEEAFLYYGGHFSNRRRNANSLARVVADYLQLKAGVRQFQGQWLYLESEDQSSLTENRLGEGWNNQLGNSVVVGDRVWGIENSFRLRLGPLGYERFVGLTPQGDLLREVAQLVRSFSGAEFDFDVQLVLKRDEVPETQLGGGQGSRLGWNTWIANLAHHADVDDAVFRVEGWPNDCRSDRLA